MQKPNLAAYGPQPHPPPQQPPPLNGGSGPIEVDISLPPFITDAKTEMARLAGCSQLGQSAPVALIDWSFSNLWSQVGHIYSYRGIAATSQNPIRYQSAVTELNLTEAIMKRQELDHR
tara:strand:- start:583 stop:936 length:354 start_codon:yes stop_codon:yes gene_type:complete